MPSMDIGSDPYMSAVKRVANRQAVLLSSYPYDAWFLKTYHAKLFSSLRVSEGFAMEEHRWWGFDVRPKEPWMEALTVFEMRLQVRYSHSRFTGQESLSCTTHTEI